MIFRLSRLVGYVIFPFWEAVPVPHKEILQGADVFFTEMTGISTSLEVKLS